MNEVPPDRIFTDLTAAQIETLKQSYGKAALEDRILVDFTESQQDGLFTLRIHFSQRPAVADPSPAPGSPLAAHLAAGTTPDRAAVGQQPIDFAAGGRALARGEFDQAIADLGGPEPQMLWALIKKESETLTGFLSDRRPSFCMSGTFFPDSQGIVSTTAIRISAVHGTERANTAPYPINMRGFCKPCVSIGLQP
jgi:hypothetical protein